MVGRQKILSVLKCIKRHSEINPYPDRILFEFNNSVVGSGILFADEEKRILSKLYKEGILKTYLDEHGTEEVNLIQYPEPFLGDLSFVYIKIFPAFYRKYFWYSLTSFGENGWNFMNPFWICWQFIRGFIFFLEWLWGKSKIATLLIGALGGLLVYDWSRAWENLKIILGFLKILWTTKANALIRGI